MTQVSGDITSGEMTFRRLDRLPNRVLKQQRRRRLWKRQLKSEFALLQSLSRLFHFVYFVKCWQMFLELNSKGLRYQSSGKEKESCCLVFPSSTKRELRRFHVVVVQWRQRNVPKSVMHVQSCRFANQTYCFFAVPGNWKGWKTRRGRGNFVFFTPFPSPVFPATLAK